MAAVFGAARAQMRYLPHLHSAAEDVAYFSERVLPTSSVLVAVAEPGPGDWSGGEVVGFCALGEGWINHLYVTPNHQGQGIGSALVARALLEHPGDLSLWVFEENVRARALYGRLGFLEVERTDGRGNEERQPDVRMHRPERTVI